MASTTIIFDLIGRDGASKAFRSAAASAETAGARISSVGKKINSVGVSMTRGITLPAVALGGVAAKMAVDFNSAMTRIQTQAGASAKDVKLLSAEVLALGGKVQQTPLELANALYHLKSVGLDNADAMKALAQSSHLAAVGNADLEETTNAVAGAWRTGIRGAQNFKGAVSTLNAIIGAGNMTMSDLNDAIGTGFLPAAKTFGLSLHDVGSALAVMTDEGVPANAAATRLRMSFSLLGAPSHKAAMVLGDIGISVAKMGHTLRDQGIVGAIGLLKTHMEGLSKVAKANLLSQAFGGGRSSAAIMTLVNNFDVLKLKEKQVTDGMSKFGADVTKQAQTPQAKLKELESTLATLGVQIGDHLLPAVISSARGLENFLGWFDKLSPGVKKTAAEVGIFLIALGPVLAITGRLTMAYGGFVKILGVTDAAMGRMTASTIAGKAASTEAATATEAQATATQGLSAKMAGLRFGGTVAGLGLMAAGAKSSNDSIKTLTTVGGAALLGFSMGGPIGAAIGAGAGAIYTLTRHIKDAADVASGARSEFKGLGDTLDSLTGQVTNDTRKFIENELVRTGALKSLATYGINTRTAVSAILGEGKARDIVTAAVKNQASQTQGLRDQISQLTAANVADAKAGTLTPQDEAARKAKIDSLQAEIDKEDAVRRAVLNGIPATRQAIHAKRLDIAATADYTGKLKGVPKQVKTYLTLHNMMQTKKGIAEVAHKFHLLPKQVSTLIQATGRDFTVKQIQSVIDKMKEAGKTKADLAVYQTSLRAGAHTAEGLARDMGFGVKTKAEQGPKEAKANLDRFTASIKAAAQNAQGVATTGGHSVGDALSAGVIAGFAGTGDTLSRQAASAVTQAIAAARKAADAHSPSRKMAQLGRDLMDGLLQGIASREMTVQKAMERIQGVIDKVGTKISSLMSTRKGFMSTFTSDSVFGADLSKTTTDAEGNQTTTPGTLADLIAFQKTQANHARRFMRDVKKTTKMGLSKDLIKQLQAQGESGAAQLHLLAQGSPDQIRQLNRLNKQTNASLKSAGMRAGNYVRGGSINADIRTAQKQEHILELLEHHLKDLAHSEKKGQTIIVKIDSEAFITAVHRRNARKGVKTAGI
jgi:TP901 family phage tail tape measure protein